MSNPQQDEIDRLEANIQDKLDTKSNMTAKELASAIRTIEESQPTPHSDSELDDIIEEVLPKALRVVYSSDLKRKSLKKALIQWSDRRAEKLVVEARNIGLKYADGSPIKLGDTVDVPYITPLGDLTDDIDEDKRAVVVFERGLYGLKYPNHTSPLRDYCRRSKGEYVSNYGEPIIFSDVTILVKAALTATKEEARDE